MYYNGLYLSSSIQKLNHSNGQYSNGMESEIHTTMVAATQGLSMPKYCSQYFWYKGFSGPVDGPPPVDNEMKQMVMK